MSKLLLVCLPLTATQLYMPLNRLVNQGPGLASAVDLASLGILGLAMMYQVRAYRALRRYEKAERL